MTSLIIFLSWFLFIFIFFYVYRFQGKYIFFNSTFFVFLFFLIYYSFPIIFNIYYSNYYVDNYRLKILNITENENFNLSLHLFVGTLGFLSSFLFSKNKIKLTKLYFKDKNILFILLFLIISLNLVKYFYLNLDTSNFTSRTDAYLFARELSLGERLSNKFVNVGIFYLELIFVFKFFQYFSSNKKIIFIFIFIFILNFYLNFNPFTQRSEIFMQLTILIIAYNLFVNKISFRLMTLIGFISFFILISWGAFREGGEFFSFESIKNLGEFDMIYANFIDLYREAPELIIFKTKFYDFYSFVPSFFLWFEKSSLPIWFLQNYHYEYYSVGGGLGFGLLSESLYGFGLIETFIRAFFLSLLLNYLFRKYLTSKSIYFEIYYILLFISAPLSIRVTSFHFLSDVIQFGFLISFSIFILQKLLNINKYNKNSNGK